jgi:hypothetical protein
MATRFCGEGAPHPGQRGLCDDARPQYPQFAGGRVNGRGGGPLNPITMLWTADC